MTTTNKDDDDDDGDDNVDATLMAPDPNHAIYIYI